MSSRSGIRGLPYLSLIGGEEGRRMKLLEAVETELGRRSLQGKGEATCPHCRYKLPWMELTRTSSVFGSAVVGLILGALAGWVVSIPTGWDLAASIGASAALGFVMLAIVGYRADISPKALQDSDPKDLRAMDEAEWAVFADAALERRVDPGEAWWHLVLEKPMPTPGHAVVGLPPLDETAQAGRLGRDAEVTGG
jgi:hypothetical protein